MSWSTNAAGSAPRERPQSPSDPSVAAEVEEAAEHEAHQRGVQDGARELAERLAGPDGGPNRMPIAHRQISTMNPGRGFA